jgi:hypothetical protein
VKDFDVAERELRKLLTKLGFNIRLVSLSVMHFTLPPNERGLDELLG